MDYKEIQTNKWTRKETYNHYLNNPCSYSVTKEFDVTNIVNSKNNFYPIIIFLISKVVNEIDEFKTTILENGKLVIYNKLNPCYTVFHKNTETFSNIWTEYEEDIESFISLYNKDIIEYGDDIKFFSKPNLPGNAFNISMLPWFDFDSFNLNIKNTSHFLPIFTIGKYYEKENRIKVHISIQINHAICDGFHVSIFIKKLEEELNKYQIVDIN